MNCSSCNICLAHCSIHVHHSVLSCTKSQGFDVFWALHDICMLVSAASGSGQLSYDTLYSKLSTTKGHVYKTVLIRFFAAATPLANQQLLFRPFDLPKPSPASSTKASLRDNEGLFNGAFAGGTISRCATVCSVLPTYLIFTWL